MTKQPLDNLDREPNLANLLKKALEISARREAHGSISVQKREPSKIKLLAGDF
jgi:hypothetical protein